MKQNQPLPTLVVLKIIKLKVNDGLGYHRIAREVDVHWQTVRKYIKLYEEL